MGSVLADASDDAHAALEREGLTEIFLGSPESSPPPAKNREIVGGSSPSPAKLPQSNFLGEFGGLRKPRNPLNTF
jgi:hypothetical protein